MLRRIALSVALVAATAGRAPLPAAAHGDIPESDVSCTGPALLNDDLAPRTATGALGHTHRIVSARAEILAANGSAVGTFYLDDRGDRYVTFELGTSAAVLADFAISGASAASAEAATSGESAPSGSPVPLARDFALNERYRLSACR